MKVLVTGARGFLGRSVVTALLRRGHLVRALDMPVTRHVQNEARKGVEEIQADLCASPDLEAACDGVEGAIHLAARMEGDDESVVKTAVEGTRRLLDAMERTGVRRMVLASSLSVYDWTVAPGLLDEDSPLELHPEARDGYTTAKLRQEQLARERCARSGISLTVLRPGVLWGAGREYPPTIGQHVGPLHVLVDGARQLPLVHVENCADAFAAALDPVRGVEGTFNVIDHPEITVRRFVRDHLRRSGSFGVTVSTPYRMSLRAVTLLHRVAPGYLRQRLPSFAAPARFAARYGPVRIEGARFREAFGWHPPLSHEECLDRTYGASRSG